MTRMSILGLVLILSACGDGPMGPEGPRGLTGPIGPVGPRGTPAIYETKYCSYQWDYEAEDGEKDRHALLLYTVTLFTSGDALVSLLNIYTQGELTHKQTTTALWARDLVEESELYVGDSIFSAKMKGAKAVFAKAGVKETKEVDCETH